MKKNNFNFSIVKKDLDIEIKKTHENTSKSFEYGPLWTKELLIDFLCNIICSTDNKTKNIFKNVYMKSYVKQILHSILKCTNKNIIKIYWFEFMKIRNQFFSLVLNVQSLYVSKLSDTLISLQQFILNYESNVDDIKTIVKKYVKNGERLKCKICMQLAISKGFIHNKHICTICDSCAKKCIERSDLCPFCRLPIQEAMKLII
jgi:hypothetical protein